MNNTTNILIVDDDPGLLQLLEMRLTAYGYQVECASDGLQAMTILKQKLPTLVITDLRMDEMDGLELFKAIRDFAPGIPVIILTAHGTIPEAVTATQQGVFSFLTKPVDKDELRETVENAVRASVGATETHATNFESKIVTCSSKMHSLLGQVRLLSNSEVSVLINGESGTGKELLAQEIHDVSSRSNEPFVPINCAAIPEELLESELFGHKKGAFTGAAKDHKGLFQTANKGTLFLDEIGDMPASLQVKLLRVLQERCVRPVGSTQYIPIDVRLISATHKNLDQEIKEKRFREDLYYRLNVVNFLLPALRDRKEDIPLLINHFLTKLAEKTNQDIKHLSPDALMLLLHYDWPGNIRQLVNVMEQLFALSPTNMIAEHLVQDALRMESNSVPSLTEAKRIFEKDYAIQLLQLTKGNMSEAADLAKRNRTDFYKIIKRHDIDPNAFKP